MDHALTQFRRKKKLTLEAFAEQVGATKGTVWKWENGKAIPRPAYMMKIVDLTRGKVSADAWYRRQEAA